MDFTIPANSTSADFNGQGSQILLQTGTVAETVTLTPSFATTAGVDVTPSRCLILCNLPSLPRTPSLESVQITNTTASSFTLQMVGYSTIRDLTSLNVTFNPASGFNLATTQFTIDVSQAAKVWFQSAASLAFGGLFQISVPFNLTGTVPANETLLKHHCLRFGDDRQQCWDVELPTGQRPVEMAGSWRESCYIIAAGVTSALCSVSYSAERARGPLVLVRFRVIGSRNL